MPSAPVPRRPMTPFEWSLLLALSAIWGGSFLFNAVALRDLPVLTVVVVRVAVAASILMIILVLQGQRPPRGGRVWTAFFGMGLVNNAIPFVLIVWGQQHIASGMAAILNAATPLFTALLAHLWTTDERLTPGRLVGVVTGFAGVAVLIGPSVLRDLGAQVAAQGACLAAALSYACAGLYGRRFRAMGVTPIATAAGQLSASSLILLPLMLVVDRPWTLPAPGPATILALMGIATLSTALAYVLYFRILATAGATNLLLVTFLIPVSAMLLGALFLGEAMAPRQFGGMALIGLGLAAIDGRVLGSLRRQD